MSYRRFWSPGIAGFLVLACEIAFTYRPGRGPLFDLLPLATLTLPLTTVLCAGPVVKAVLAQTKLRRAHTQPTVLRWLDIILGCVGIGGSFFIYIIFEPARTSVSDVILPLIFFLFVCSLWYVLSSKWKALGLGAKITFAIAWTLLCVFSYFTVLFSRPLADILPNRSMIMNDLWNLAAQGYQYRLQPHHVGGGNGSYVGFTLPEHVSSSEHISYSIVTVAADTLVFRCVGSVGGGVVTVRLDTNGQLTDWNIQGKLDPWDDDWRVEIWDKWFVR